MQVKITDDSIELVPEDDDDRARLMWWRKAIPDFANGPTKWAPLPWAPDRRAFQTPFRINFVPKDES